MTDKNILWQGARRQAPQADSTSAVLLLHGLGSNADDLISLAPDLAQALPHTVFISPNAPFACDMAPFGRQWFSLQSWSSETMWEGANQAAAYIREMIADIAAEYKLPYNKIALVGFSQGCMMALHVAPRLPQCLGAVVGLSGALIGGEKLAAEAINKPPILLIHGQLDPIVPYAAMLAASDFLHHSGFKVETETRPLLAHNVDNQGIARARDFLSQHLK